MPHQLDSLNDRVYHLVNAEERAELHPGRFTIPDLEQRRTLGPDFLAKLVFELDPPAIRGRSGERLWVEIEQRNVAGDGSVIYRGRLRNHPVALKGARNTQGELLEYNALIWFEPKHVADYEVADQERRPEAPPAPVTTPAVSTPVPASADLAWDQAGDPSRRS